ncbi:MULTISPECIES: T9SS type A sorting domain-containing protein [Flavobacterium]|uniref:T9SS type A sorting domain-containing protein n=1 Tax=Flavobacterium TaxID=237 RepID=UPI001FCB8E9D|nr:MULTISPECIES: T9SS type A sorting domain-containing protein [Flavobacterium]UOK41720.1 T9SS type A sorting domain-containing protein [Flavobacterium enshiense]
MRKIIFLISFLASLIGFAQGGSLDFSFNFQGTVSPETILKIQPDGKLILLEKFRGIDDLTEYTKISRLYPDGSYDMTFSGGIGLIVFNEVSTLAIQSDGKILIAGNFAKIEDGKVSRMARLNQDGSFDESFAEADYTGIETIAVLPDDKILIGGDFPEGIVRLYSNGGIDPFFESSIDSKPEGQSVSNIVVMKPDNKIIAAGHVTVNGIDRRVFMLNSDGALDTTFNEPLNIDWADGDLWRPQFLALDNKDNILIGWPFRVFSEPNEDLGFNFVRLSPNGNIVTYYHPTPITNDCVLGIFPAFLQDDGKIIMTGNECIDYYGTEFNGILRLNSDGSLDETFNPGNGIDGVISSVAVQPDDGKIIIAGSFNEYNGFAVPNLIRITTERLSTNGFDSTGFAIYPNPVADFLYIQFPDGISDADIDELEIYDVTMKKIDFDGLNEDVIDVSGFSEGVYLIKIKTIDSIYTSKFVKH